MSLDLAHHRTLNLNQGDLYEFFTNDTNAFNNIVSIGGQLVGLTVVLGGASLVYTAIRGDQISSDLELNSVISDLTRDQTAAQNIFSTLGYSTIIAASYYFLSQLGEPANSRRKDEDDNNLLYQTNFIDRQGFNPLDAVTGFLDPILSYSAVFRTLVFYGLGASGILIFWAFMSLLPNSRGRKRRSVAPHLTHVTSMQPWSEILQHWSETLQAAHSNRLLTAALE